MRDDEDPTPGDSADSQMNHSTAVMVQGSLQDLLEDPPATARRAHEARANLRIWREWYEEVKAGRRTFRFKGDPQEYTLDGPVAEARVPKVESRTIKPDEVRRADANETPESEPPTPWLPLFATLAVLAAAGFWYVRNRT